MQFVVILVLAFAPGIFWLWMVVRRDRFRPEPRALVTRTFLWGAAVAVPVAAVESLLVYLFDPQALEPLADVRLPIGTAAYMSFIVAGITEELGKYLVVRRTVYRSLYFDEPMDGLVYASASALGFASLENVGYLMVYGWEAILLRGPFSTLAHVLFSAMWGYPLGISKVNPSRTAARVWLGLAASMLTHGLFDFLLFTESAYSYLTIPLFIAAGAVFLLMLRRAARVSPFREMIGHLMAACPSCGERIPYHARYCTSCGTVLGATRANGPAFCGRCGATLHRRARYCPSCGARLLRGNSAP